MNKWQVLGLLSLRKFPLGTDSNVILQSNFYVIIRFLRQVNVEKSNFFVYLW